MLGDTFVEALDPVDGGLGAGLALELGDLALAGEQGRGIVGGKARGLDVVRGDEADIVRWVGLDSAVDQHHRDPGLGRTLHHRSQALAVERREGDALDAARDQRLDRRHLLLDGAVPGHAVHLRRQAVLLGLGLGLCREGCHEGIVDHRLRQDADDRAVRRLRHVGAAECPSHGCASQKSSARQLHAHPP